MGTILLVILILMVGSSTWPHSRNWDTIPGGLADLDSDHPAALKDEELSQDGGIS
jgi:hypothetical protein